MAAPLQIASISQIVDPATRATFNDLIKVLNSPTGIGPGWVTSVTGSGNIASSGGTTPNITFTGILPTANGGTGIAYFTAAGPTVARTYTFPDADASIARIDAGQTFVGTQAFADGTFSGTLGVTGVATLGGNAFPTITGTNDQVLTTNGSGTLSWTDKAGGGGGGITALNSQTGATQTFTDDTNVTIVSGSDAHVITWAGTLAVARGGTGSASLGSTNTQVLFNDGGALAGNSGFTFNKTTNLILNQASLTGAHVANRIENTHTAGWSTIWLGTANEGLIRGGSTASAWASQLVLLSAGSTPLLFATNSVERMRISSAGAVTIPGALTVTTNITDSALTAGRVVFAGTAGLLDDDSGFTYNASTGALAVQLSVNSNINMILNNPNTGSSAAAYWQMTSDAGGGLTAFTGSVAGGLGSRFYSSSVDGFKLYTTVAAALGFGADNSSADDLVIDTSHNVVVKTALRLTETGGGTDYVGFQAPAAITTSKVYTLPSADGTTGQVLQTNGSAVLSWAANGAGYWTYTNSPANSSYNAFNIIADIDPTTDVVRIGDQTIGPITPPGTAQLSVINRWGGQAIVGTSKSSDLSNTYVGTIPADARMSTSGAYLLTDHDSTEGGLSIGTYGAYIEARGSAGLTSTLGVTWGLEISPQNLSGTASVPIPSSYYPGGRNIAGLLIQAAGSSSGTTYDSSAALVIGANAANGTKGDGYAGAVSFNKGIIFLDYSIATNSSNMEAIAMSAGHQLSWTALGTTTPVGRLSSDGTHLTWASNGTTPKVKSPQFESTVATGTPPLVIASSSYVANLFTQYSTQLIDGSGVNHFYRLTGGGVSGKSDSGLYVQLVIDESATNYYLKLYID